jgi:hypothetical protein
MQIVLAAKIINRNNIRRTIGWYVSIRSRGASTKKKPEKTE